MQIFLPQMCCLLNVIFKKNSEWKKLTLTLPSTRICLRFGDIKSCLCLMCVRNELPSKIYLKHLFAINKYDKFWNISLDYFIKH